MPFALPEYDAAFGRFFGQSMRVLAVAHSPLLAEMSFIESSGTLGSRIRTRDGMDVELDPGATETSVTADLDAVRTGDFEKLHEAMYAGAAPMAEQLVGYFVESMGKVTEGTGNVVDAGDQPFGFDVFYETLDKIEFSLDEHGELVMPRLLMHPTQAEKMRDLPPLTPEQERKLADLKERKREEALARRRRRRLS